MLKNTAPLIINPTLPAQSAVIWMHGLGADGNDFKDIVPELNLPKELAVRFIFPHAPMRPITINNGYVMRGWYDISGFDNLSTREDSVGIYQSQALIEKLINEQKHQGIAANKIILAGFSQGGAMALHVGLRHQETLAGILVLSAYLPLSNTLENEAHLANRKTPIMIMHGSMDNIVMPTLAETSRDILLANKYLVDWKIYNMAHTVCMQEIKDISNWLQKVITK